MARSTEVTIPATTLQVGSFTFTTPHAINATADHVQIKAQQDTWTHTGEKVWTWSIQYAADGVNFIDLTVPADVFNRPVPARFGQPADQEELGTEIPDVGLTTRKLRMQLVVVESQSISGGSLEIF